MTSIGTLFVNHVAQHSSTSPCTVSCLVYRLSLVVFNWKLNASFLEAVFIAFVYLCLFVKTSS